MIQCTRTNSHEICVTNVSTAQRPLIICSRFAFRHNSFVLAHGPLHRPLFTILRFIVLLTSQRKQHDSTSPSSFCCCFTHAQIGRTASSMAAKTFSSIAAMLLVPQLVTATSFDYYRSVFCNSQSSSFLIESYTSPMSLADDKLCHQTPAGTMAMKLNHGIAPGCVGKLNQWMESQTNSDLSSTRIR